MAGVTGDMRITTRALRQEVFAVPAPPGLLLADGAPFVADLDLGQYFRPRPAGRCSSAAPRRRATSWSGSTTPTTSTTWRRSRAGSGRRCGWPGACRRSASRRGPSGLAALYDVTDDWVPIYDRSSLDGFFMACGTSGNQFKNAPLAGQFIRALVDAAGGRHRPRRRPGAVRRPADRTDASTSARSPAAGRRPRRPGR